jgi:phosphoglycolate phosphatase-like HAD superfamily hydrolase
MIFRAMEAAHVHDVREVLAIGDTVLDLQAANNAGVGAVIGVYSGACDRRTLTERAQQRRLTQRGILARPDQAGTAAVALPRLSPPCEENV